ncbi:MAG: competence protein ComEC [Caulobacteraceae bacterium]|nr:MAG: competence protein ComEC [Caulobacteraceae bacterium]
MAGTIALQHDRWALWPPVAMILGAAAWMSTPIAPASWIAPLVLTTCGGLGMAIATAPLSGAGRLRMAAAGAFLLIAAFALGAVAGGVRSEAVAAPRITQELGPARLTGWVLDAEPGATRPRMKVLVSAIDGVNSPPRYVRLSVNAVLSPGRSIDCLVLLRPPEGPMAPRAFDFARRAWFQKIGATGIALGRCRPTAAPPPLSLQDRVMLFTTAVRRDLTESIVTASPGEGGAIAAALVTGDRSFMTDATNVAFRDSGLGHLLSVSGLHMALVAGGIFAALHFLLALLAPIALRYPIRKWAAAAALIGAAAYLVVSGASVPAQRAFVMTAVALGAVLIDRPAFSLRALALAAVIVVLISPESVVDPGFQMSFAATAALIAAFEQPLRAPGPVLAPGLILGGLDASWRLLSGMLVASLVAGLATDVFAIYHFQRVAVYGLASNLASTPLISFVIAPSAVIAAVLAPFGLADIPLAIMAGALDMVAAIGRVFAERPEAVRPMPVAPAMAFLLAVGAIIWTCLWRGPLRWLGALALLASGIVYVSAPKSVLWADGDLRAVVAQTQEGWIAAADVRRGSFAKGRMGGLAGLSAAQTDKLPPPDICNRDVCTWRTPRDRQVFRVYRQEGLVAACRTDAIILSDVPVDDAYKARCAPAAVIDPVDLAQKGGLSMTETAAGVQFRRARDDAGYRIWSGKLRRIDE